MKVRAIFKGLILTIFTCYKVNDARNVCYADSVREE